MARSREHQRPAPFPEVSSRYQEPPAWPRRFARRWSASRGAKRTSQARDRLVRDLEAALEEQRSDVAEAQLGAETPAYGEQHAVRWVLQIVEGRAGPLVEAPPAGLAAEPPGAERGAPLPPRRRRGCTVWTSQQRPLTVPWMRRAETGVP